MSYVYEISNGMSMHGVCHQPDDEHDCGNLPKSRQPEGFLHADTPIFQRSVGSGFLIAIGFEADFRGAGMYDKKYDGHDHD